MKKKLWTCVKLRSLNRKTTVHCIVEGTEYVGSEIQ